MAPTVFEKNSTNSSTLLRIRTLSYEFTLCSDNFGEDNHAAAASTGPMLAGGQEDLMAVAPASLLDPATMTMPGVGPRHLGVGVSRDRYGVV